jgi:hypothetical protein
MRESIPKKRRLMKRVMRLRKSSTPALLMEMIVLCSINNNNIILECLLCPSDVDMGL